MAKKKPLTAEIIGRLTVECPFPEVFEDTESADGIIKTPKQKIAHIRADHDGYQWWNTVWLAHDELASMEMKREIDATYQALTAPDAFADLNTVTRFCLSHTEACPSKEHLDEFNFYLRGELCDYWIRLITRKGDYNMYLSAYTKKETAEQNPNQKYFDYLEQLRESGETNMMGAVPYLQRKFPELGFDIDRARKIHREWMGSYKEDKSR